MKENLIKILLANGFTIRDDDAISFHAIKKFQTIIGERELNINIYSSTPNRVNPYYFSEGRNILEAYSFPLSCDIQKELDYCEKLVRESYPMRIKK